MRKNILAVRLGARERRLLEETRRRLGVSRSEVVREAIARYAEQSLMESETTAAERLAPWIGRFEGGEPGLSENAGARWRKRLLEKHGRRSR